MKPKVLIPEPIASAGLDRLRASVECVAPWTQNRDANPQDGRALLADADAVIVRLFKVTAEDLRSCTRLKVIAKHGVGVDNIDLAAAAERGVRVVFTPEANSNAVAEHTVALILSLARQIPAAAVAARTGRFSDRNQFQGVELHGKTLGVIGLGRIGMKVASMAMAGFGMNVIGYDPYRTSDPLPIAIETAARVEQVFELADFLTFHVPLNDATRRLVCDETLALVKPDCRIVNTSRGGVIDEQALVAALEQGSIAGAALDVFQQEPLPESHELCRAPNLLLTPHISSSTRESLDRMSIDAATGVLDVLAGREPKFPVS